MALFIDGNISTLADLRAQESSILDLASSEGIDLSAKLTAAQEEIELELMDFLSRQTEPNGNARSNGFSEIQKIVVTRVLRTWHTVKALELIYKDCYSSYFNDRYLRKWREYEKAAARAEQRCLSMGIGMVWDPIRKANAPNIELASGDLEAGIYWIHIAWTNAECAEGAASDVTSFALEGKGGMCITTAEAPENVRGWNVYLGTDPEETMRQNDTPLAIGATWKAVGAGIKKGARAGNGQAPDYYVRLMRLVERG
jgi:hypothetical protein